MVTFNLKVIILWKRAFRIPMHKWKISVVSCIYLYELLEIVWLFH